MTKQEALLATQKRFNLLDGKVVSNVGVATIIAYYESLLSSVLYVQVPKTSNIEQNFIEDEIDELTEYEQWDGDASYLE
jgi:hypothetical protein